MRALVLFNPIAGAGRAAKAAAEIGESLRTAGIESALSPTRRGRDDAWLTPLLTGADALVIVGGDGAVRSVAGAASRSGKPLYQVPLGTENLFARQFGMDAQPATLVRALKRFEIQSVDLGQVNDQAFVSMVSIGYDAEVVHDLARRRAGSISHWSYGAPMLRQLLRWRPEPVTVIVDGQRLADAERGCVIVANSRHYAFGLDPCREAVMTDGLLDVAFLPVQSRLDLIRWIARCRLGTQMSDCRFRFQRGRRIEVICTKPQHFQIDGDAPLDAGGDALSAPVKGLQIDVRPQALMVLLPATGAD